MREFITNKEKLKPYNNMSASSEKKQTKNWCPLSLSSLKNKYHEDQASSEYKKGDIIAFYRKDQRITHYGIYIGNGVIIHVAGENKNDSEVRIEALDLVKNGDKSWVANNDEKLGKPADAAEIEERAIRKKGKFEYNVIFNNCKHFANFCRYGKEYSSQTDLWETILPWKKFLKIYNRLKTEILENILPFKKFVQICRKVMERVSNA
ncbi:hypothetical protein Btru_063699 [Bulinus truncatus]|nr:hypothetical protein Btru_063699 [Bulinus truncatus]